MLDQEKKMKMKMVLLSLLELILQLLSQIVQDSSNDDSQVQDQVGSSSAPSPSTYEPIVPQKIHHILAKNHPVDQIMGDISKGVQTRSRIASFCEHYSFVCFLESNRVDEALRDPDWVNAMHEELN